MKQPIKVVILPTKGKTYKSGLYFDGTNFTLYNTTNSKSRAQYVYITISQDIEPIKEGDWAIYKNSDGNVSILCQAYKHKDDDIMLFDTNNGSYDRSTGEGITPLKDYVRKIIATTDVLIIEDNGYTDHISQVQQSFLEEFVTNPEGEYEVEYELKHKTENELNMGEDPFTSKPKMLLKLNQDNTVTITAVKESPIHIHEGIRNTHVDIIDGVIHVKPTSIGEKTYTEKELLLFGEHVLKITNSVIKKHTKMKPLDDKSGPLLVKDLLEDWVKENL